MQKPPLRAVPLLCSLLAGVAPAAAQAPPAEATAGEIVVTAQRREQRLQDVPLAVTAFSETRFDDLQLDDASDLRLVVPNFSFTSTNFGGVNYSIRGIGRNVEADADDSGVAILVNGAYLQGGGNQGLYFDLAGVEVLRGPQGTLFGRNATGGAVNVRTAKPDLDGVSGEIEGIVGENETRELEGVLNVPLSDAFGARVAFLYNDFEGTTRDPLRDETYGGGRTVSVQGSLRWEPDDDTVIDLVVSHYRFTGDGLQGDKRRCLREPIGNLGCSPDALGDDQPNYLATLGGQFATALGLVAPGQDPYLAAPRLNDPREVALDFSPRQYTRQVIGTLEAGRDFGDLRVDALAAYTYDDGSYETDNDLTTLPAGSFGEPPGLEALFPGGFVPSAPAIQTIWACWPGAPRAPSTAPTRMNAPTGQRGSGWASCG